MQIILLVFFVSPNNNVLLTSTSSFSEFKILEFLTVWNSCQKLEQQTIDCNLELSNHCFEDIRTYDCKCEMNNIKVLIKPYLSCLIFTSNSIQNSLYKAKYDIFSSWLEFDTISS